MQKSRLGTFALSAALAIGMGGLVGMAPARRAEPEPRRRRKGPTVVRAGELPQSTEYKGFPSRQVYRAEKRAAEKEASRPYVQARAPRKSR